MDQKKSAVPTTDPWEWYIYLHEWLIFMVKPPIPRYLLEGSSQDLQVANNHVVGG